ncbi:putative disease resistance protein RGA1 [Abrus precatorius]|uniref:Disease resistance protein RGA1 n=1 Tax=Abrus precatorius TaxID=3816 RepID=A0A8B8JZZ0_ABRPR|nr:putative disease resistance protein RGA1 [Abrus precatorius]
MAESVQFAVTSNLRLASADFLEFGKQYNVREALEELKNTIESINDKLLDAEDKQDQDVGVRVWIRRFKKVLHQADDFLDKLAIQSTRDKLGAAEGKEVNKDLNLSPRSRVVKKTNSEWRETCSFVLESDIIGRDDSKKEIISLLRQPHEKQTVSVIAIVGIGGLGKTALAQLVYNDLEVQNFFEMQMWVCVSDNFDVKTILKKILESITGNQIEVKISLDNLQKRLREKISGKKYLLVLDDIWNENNKKWAEVRTHLMCGAQDSKILVTTRSEIAAKTMSASTSYLLKALTEKESWSLLKKTAFEDGSEVVNQNLESMGKEIAGKCKGIPLAVKTLGGLLRGQYEESKWKDVLHGDFWKLCREQDSIVPILKLSYQNLSPEMRQCFAYCSIYPKDWIIFNDELIQLWMAQGYLQCSTDKQCMEDIDAESEDGEIISFKIHDLMHDLAMLVAGNDYCYLDSKAKKLVGRPMHVSLELEAIHLLDLLDENRLRTLILWSYDEDIEGELPVANFKYLRVLKMPCSSIVKLSASAEQLEHLRYLDLFDSAGRVSLPKFICNLVFLQTLKLGNCDESFSKDVAKLVNLRFLDIVDYDDSFTGMAVGLRKLCSLQILSIFIVGDRQEINYGTLNELKDLIRGKLRMKHLDRVRDVAWESQDVNLKQKKFLQSLTLTWSYQDICNSDSLQLLENLKSHHNLKRLKVNYYPGVLFPNWLSLLTNVVDISLYAFDKCRFLPPLERLPYLMSLVIELLPELEYIYIHEDGFAETFFPSLKSLVLRGCGQLRGWLKPGDDINDSQNISSPYSFPHLSHLEVSICPQLTCMPTFPNLKDLKWYQCSAEPLTETLNTTSTCSVDSSSSAAPLSMLKDLEISDPINLRKGWMQNLTSLESLRIQGCHSETLEEFQTGFKDDTNCLISLQQITILGCEKLKALPDWICNLSSLQHISIFGCPKLVSLPQGMSRLTNLKIFEVDSCSLLLEECRTATSAICLQIAHIPQIILLNRLS